MKFSNTSLYILGALKLNYMLTIMYTFYSVMNSNGKWHLVFLKGTCLNGMLYQTENLVYIYILKVLSQFLNSQSPLYCQPFCGYLFSSQVFVKFAIRITVSRDFPHLPQKVSFLLFILLRRYKDPLPVYHLLSWYKRRTSRQVAGDSPPIYNATF